MADNRHSAIVVGIDGSPESLGALRWALTEGVTRGSSVEVVHSYLPQTLTDFTFGLPHELHTASVMMVEGEVAAALAEMPERPDVVQSSRPDGPDTALLEKAKSASLLVLGAHGHTSLRDIVLGQVAASVIRHARCPVVIVGLDHDTVTYNPSEAEATRA